MVVKNNWVDLILINRSASSRFDRAKVCQGLLIAADSLHFAAGNWRRETVPVQFKCHSK